MDEVNHIMGKIAIEPNLSPIGDYLAQKGYQVESVNPGTSPGVNLNAYQAIIVTGQHNNFMGIGDTETKAAVIDATGMTPQDVLRALKQQEEKNPSKKLRL
jgi:hypothetical protein